MLNKLIIDNNGQLVEATAVNDPTLKPGNQTKTTTQDTNNQPVNKIPFNGGTDAVKNQQSTDWSSMLGIYGLPPDVAAKVQQIFQSTSDINQAVQLALAYVRGTDWYAKTYPGIQEGIARGIISNEADYRAYLNNVNILSKQYLGRDISGQELAGYLSQGFNVDRIGRIFQGGAIAKTSGQDWRYVTGAFDENGPLTTDEQQALGQEQAGIDTALGQRVQRRLALAQQRLQGVFQGSLATTGLSTSGGRLASTTLGGNQTPDVAA